MSKIISEKVANIQVLRKEGKIRLNLRVSPEIEAIFESICKEHGVNAEKHKNKLFDIEWYPVPTVTTKFKKWSNRYYLHAPNKGMDLDKQFNFSFLFAKGISKGVSFEFIDLASKDQLEQYAKELNTVIHEVYNEFVSDLAIEHDMKLKYISA